MTDTIPTLRAYHLHTLQKAYLAKLRKTGYTTLSRDYIHGNIELERFLNDIIKEPEKDVTLITGIDDACKLCNNKHNSCIDKNIPIYEKKILSGYGFKENKVYKGREILEKLVECYDEQGRYKTEYIDEMFNESKSVLIAGGLITAGVSAFCFLSKFLKRDPEEKPATNTSEEKPMEKSRNNEDYRIDKI